jgi:hypothetical protein
MSQKQKLSLASIAALALIAACIGVALFSGRHHAPPQPADFPAAPQMRTRPTDPPPFGDGAVEAAAGGKLSGGQWQFGYKPDPEATQRFLRSLPKPTIGDAAPHLLKAADDGKPVYLYRVLNEAYAAHHGGAKWVVGKQGIGDCVSWGWAHGLNICLAIEWKLGQSSEWREAATEAIYGGSRVEARGVSRGGYSDGSYGGAAGKFVHDWGALFRQPYNDLGFDLTTYSAARAKDWGNYGCGGAGEKGKRADGVAKQHPVKNVALVRTFDEAVAAIGSGYPVPVCSGQGFTRQRDAQGFCRASGSWAHCMCFIDRRSDRPGLLCLNSWGPNWVSGPKWPADQPDGSFWVDKATAERMLSGQDSFAVSAYEGFPYRDLKHGDWAELGRGQSGQLAVQSRPSPEIAETPLALAP